MKTSDAVYRATAVACNKYSLFRSGCVLAVSGGPDSIALLHAVANAFLVEAAPARLLVAHVNHQLRGCESDEDEAFVRALVQQMARQSAALNLVYASARMDIKQEAARRKTNLEATARTFRYRWLADQARAHDLRWVLTAHTLDDQAETTLFHILRGTGLRGLRGMRPQRRLGDGISLIRPWLGISKADILNYVHDHQLGYRSDSSNLDLQFTRNRIRRQLLPQLQSEYNPRIRAALAALAGHAAEACRLSDREVRKLLQRAERPRVGSLLVFDTAILREQSIDLQRATFAYLWKREGWSNSDMGRAAWDRLARWLGATSPALDLPGRIRAVKKLGVVQLGPRK
jgi:tRNA(Ile)-lysidine synthetase-like protein